MRTRLIISFIVVALLAALASAWVANLILPYFPSLGDLIRPALISRLLGGACRGHVGRNDRARDRHRHRRPGAPAGHRRQPAGCPVKARVAVIGGGNNCEHEVSVASAAAVAAALAETGYQVVRLTIGADGSWQHGEVAGLHPSRRASSSSPRACRATGRQAARCWALSLRCRTP